MSQKSSHTPSPVKTTFLVLRSQTGDETAFGTLYALFAESTLRYLNGVVGGDLADDVQQEAWISVFRKLKDLENPTRFKPWLYRIIRHAAIDHLRRMQREERLFDHAHDDPEFDGRHESAELDEMLDTEAISRAISSLNAPHQEVVILRYWEAFSYAEIALVTGVPIGSVRSRLFHAKAHLKKLFETEIDPY